MKFFLSLVFACLSMTLFAQQEPTLPAYKRYPTLPPLQLLLSDSTTKYTKEDVPKNTPVLIVLFSPDCEHCQHEAEQFVANQEALKDVHIVMISLLPIYKMKAFGENYGLDKMKNVVMAKDPYYLLPSFYQIRNLPYLALYDKKGNLIQTFEGSVGVEKIVASFKSAD